MYCFNCYLFELDEIVVDDYIYYDCELPNIVLRKIKLLVCPFCHAEFAAIENRMALHQSIATELVNKRGKLTNKEITFLLRLSGYYEVDIAPMMSCGASTVNNWEMGHLRMSDVQEKYFRSLMAYKLKKRNSVVEDTTAAKFSSSIIFLHMNERGEWDVPKKVHH